ncbi:MAG: hypothetical protein QOH34_3015 [Mycobacterium sp.]|jgi:hypothetical protein|nr:hypothetical protein [Mycobacterium sp.]
MTTQGGDYGENSRDEPAPFPRPDQHHPDQPRPWQQYPHAPVDPQAPVNYPEYPPPYPPQPPPVPSYGYPPPPHGGPPRYGLPPGYPGHYDPYQPYPPYQANPYQTNGLAIASLVTSIAGVVLGIPLAFFCYLGLLIPIVGAVLGAVALNQIKQTHQQGRGLAIAGISVGSVTTALLLLIMIGLAAAAVHSPFIGR